MDRLSNNRQAFASRFITTFLLVISLGSSASYAATNIAVDGGSAFNLIPSGPVTVDALGGNAVTSATAEINPGTVIVASLANLFTYDILPVINVGDTGINEIVITAPIGFTLNGVTSLSAGGIPLTADCALNTPDDFCAVIIGQVLTITLQAPVTVTGTTINVNFTADAPAVAGSGIFTATVDDTTTILVPPQNTIDGDADGNGINSNSMTVNVALVVPDPGLSTVTANPIIVLADGAATSIITTTILDASGLPLSGRNVTLSSSRGATDSIPLPLLQTDVTGATTGTISSLTPGAAIITATDTTDILTPIILPMTATVYFTQGQVLEVTKTANRQDASIGELVSYEVEIRNLLTTRPITGVKLNDVIPPNFKYLKNSGMLNGITPLEPTGHRPIVFDIGTIPALVDTNGNGTADPGEAGYMSLSYRLIIGSGATPGDYTNTAFATDACEQCLISNRSEAEVQVTFDPLFDLGTIIGKVFRDSNQDGWQDSGEEGVGGVMIALDNGTYALTDEHGRYHFPALLPGHRLVKINLNNLGIGAKCTKGEARVVSVTPGLLAKVNFGVSYSFDHEKTGRSGEKGLLVQSSESREPFLITGNFTANALLINGRPVELPFTDIQMSFAEITDIVTINSGQLEKPIKFITSPTSAQQPTNWHFRIFDEEGETVKTFTGRGPPPPAILWDGITEAGELLSGGAVYQFQMESNFKNGTIIQSPRKMFGVNTTSMVALDLSGSAFLSGSDQLSERAKEVLQKTAAILGDYPREMIIIEGHTDSVGDAESNLDLSRRRAQAAASFLVKEEGINPNRFVVNWYGESKPLASNLIAEGREHNRRVAIKGEIKEVDRAALYDQYRSAPEVSLNGLVAEVDPQGRFTGKLPFSESKELTINLQGQRGDHSQTTLALPSIDIQSTGSDGAILPFRFNDGSEQPYLLYEIKGHTEPNNILRIDGQVVAIDHHGSFKKSVPLTTGPNHFGLTAENQDGLTAITNLTITLQEKGEDGRTIMLLSPIPNLEVKFPPGDAIMKAESINISGRTEPENHLQVNGREVALNHDGSFTSKILLEPGESVISVTATDPEGYHGTISKNILVSEDELFYLAFADGKIGQFKSKGYLEGTGVDNSKDYYTEGRLAFYLKGRIKGKYLLTAAFYSGTNEFEKLFDDLDNNENDRLLTNIDPDKLYPVYGDSSTLVYDTDSQGKLYLALDSDEFSLLVGNYKVVLNDTELATFNRTIFGARAKYRSVSKTADGRPDTTLIIFGAQVRQEHIRDRIHATGGSLYYLSRREIIEGSEQVQLVIRDKDTGLQISRISQRQNFDYEIKYDEGRIIFKYPVSSIAESGKLIDQTILAGNPVYIEVDYEVTLDSFEKTGGGIRVKQQLSDNVAVGATYIKDELQTNGYEMAAVDSEIRFAGNSRVLLEYADSTGLDSASYESNDGGLTYVATTPTGTLAGSAWKASAELDIGEWFEKPGQTMLGGYYKKIESGFLSSGNSSERGSEKSGINLSIKLTDADQLKAHYDIEKYELGIPATADKIGRGTIQFSHSEEKWDLTAEYLTQDHTNPAPTVPETIDLAALRLRYKLTDKLLLTGEHQQTLSGPDNDQSTLGVDYKVLEFLDLTARATSGDLGSSGQFGAQLAIGDKRFYITERIVDDQAGHSTATIIGTEAPVGKTGKVYSEYQWQRTDNNHQAVSVVGASNKLTVAKNLEIRMSGEMADLTSTAGNTSRHTLALGVTYQRPGLKAMTNNEIRFEEGVSERTQYLTSNLLEYKLNQDLTMLGKYRYSITEDTLTSTIEAQFTEFSIGLAYRPVASDRLNGLARFTHLLDQNPLTATNPLLSKISKDVGSLEWSYDISKNLEWVGKGALKISSDETGLNPSFTSHTLLFIQRLNYRFMAKFDLGTEFRTLTQEEADDRRSGFLTELMWEVVDNARLGLGYNFTDFSDNEFSDNDYSVHGWFVRMQAIY